MEKSHRKPENITCFYLLFCRPIRKPLILPHLTNYLYQHLSKSGLDSSLYFLKEFDKEYLESFRRV